MYSKAGQVNTLQKRVLQMQNGYLKVLLRNKAVSAAATQTDLKAPNSTQNLNQKSDPKPFSEVPGPKGFFQVSSSILESIRNLGQGHVLIEKKFAKYGPIYCENVGSMSLVMLEDINAVETLFRGDNKYPQRIAVDSWVKWREQANLAKGLLIQNDGPEWKRMRTQLDKRMMRPHHVATYTNDFNNVVTDFIKRLNHIRATEGNGIRVPNLDIELFHWSLETIGTVLYERRFGGLSNERNPEIQEFVNAVHNVFSTTESLFMFPFKYAKYLAPKEFTKHVKAWETIFSTGKKFIDEKMEEIQCKLDDEEEVAGFLSTLLASKVLSQSEVYANISELMLGAVDTTSNTMQWVIEALSRDQDIQDRLRHEIMSVTNGDVTDHEALQKMPYLKAVIKEVLRLHPIAGVVTRTLSEDMILLGYLIPEGTTIIANTYIMGRNPDIFENPQSFIPERWLRSEKPADKLHNFAWLPFGFGPRMCIGRRVAELEMHLLTARLVQKFKLEALNDEPLKPVSRGLMLPERTVDVKFIDI